MENNQKANNFKNQWFVILCQSEVETVQTKNQYLVYAAIKSYSANGKKPVALSIRDIRKRALLSFGTVQATIPQICKLGMIKIIGQENHRGGAVSIYQVINDRSVKSTNQSETDQLNAKSDQAQQLSDQSISLKNTQSKNKRNNTALEENSFLQNQAGLSSEIRKKLFDFASNGDRYSNVFWNSGGKSDKTKEKRSITSPGFAKAFMEANQ